MSLSKKIAALRQKPRRVRERYLVVSMLVVAPILFVVWFVTFRFDSATAGTGFFKNIGSTVTSSFNSPVYEETFKKSSFGMEEEPTDPVTETATTTPVNP